MWLISTFPTSVMSASSDAAAKPAVVLAEVWPSLEQPQKDLACKILQNVCASPGEAKYRSVNEGKVSAKLGPAVRLLSAAGFASSGETGLLVLPSGDASVAACQQLLE